MNAGPSSLRFAYKKTTRHAFVGLDVDQHLQRPGSLINIPCVPSPTPAENESLHEFANGLQEQKHAEQERKNSLRKKEEQIKKKNYTEKEKAAYRAGWKACQRFITDAWEWDTDDSDDDDEGR